METSQKFVNNSKSLYLGGATTFFMYKSHQLQLKEKGYTVIENVFSNEAINELITQIESADKNNPLFRKTNDLFAIRRFLHAIPAVNPLIFTPAVRELIHCLFGEDYFAVKSIYFDKPGNSNWFVA